jgi:transposase
MKQITISIIERDDVHKAYQKGEDAVWVLVQEQNQTILKLAQALNELSSQIIKDSHNSGKPPSTDGLKKKPKHTESLRTISGKKPGREKGHVGQTLVQVENPKDTIPLSVQACTNCGNDLTKEEITGFVKRQVFDIPPINLEVTEYKAEKKLCPHCQTINTAPFPQAVTQPVQYGYHIKSIAVALIDSVFTSYEKARQFLSDCFGIFMSQATIMTAQNELAKLLFPVVWLAKTMLTYCQPVVHFDESGIRVNGKLYWLHDASTDWLTYYTVHRNRGTPAMQEIGILPRFSGTAQHDHYRSYYTYPCRHGECNAHHLRQLEYIFEAYHQEWPAHMATLLCLIHETVNQAKNEGRASLPEEQSDRFSRLYDAVIAEGFVMNPLPSVFEKKRGRIKHTEPQNLLLQLSEYKQETLLFMYDFSVSFDNNLSERDIRMMKVKMKIAGCFRTLHNAQAFCVIRSYASMVRKHGKNVLWAFASVYARKPYVPETILGANMQLALHP